MQRADPSESTAVFHAHMKQEAESEIWGGGLRCYYCGSSFRTTVAFSRIQSFTSSLMQTFILRSLIQSVISRMQFYYIFIIVTFVSLILSTPSYSFFRLFSAAGFTNQRPRTNCADGRAGCPGVATGHHAQIRSGLGALSAGVRPATGSAGVRKSEVRGGDQPPRLIPIPRQ